MIDRRIPALLIKRKYAELILSGEKTWELRKSYTHVRGPIYLLSGNYLLGKVKLIGVLGPFTPEELREKYKYHRASYEGFLARYAKRIYAWVLKDPVKFTRPTKVRVPRGAQLWVRNYEIVDSEIE